VLRQAQDIRAGAPKAVIVVSMVGRNYRFTKDMKDAASLEACVAGTPAQGRRTKHALGHSGAGHRAVAEIERLPDVIHSDGAGRAGTSTSGNSACRAAPFK